MMTTHLKPRSATVTLYQGDDMDRLAQLKRAADIAERQHAVAEDEASRTPSRMGDDLGVELARAKKVKADAETEFDAFVSEAADRALSVELQSIGRRRWRDLLAEHPPRMVDGTPDAEGKSVPVEHEDDAGYGVNTETFAKALLCFRDGDSRTIAAPDFATKADVERFLDDEVSEGDFDQLWLAAYFLNRNPSVDPKAVGYGTSSTASPSTDET